MKRDLKKEVKFDLPSSIEFMLEFEYPGKPESYSRERKGRGNHFYNPKGDKMRELRKFCLERINKKVKAELGKFLMDPDSTYYVSLEMKYYLPIPKSATKKEKFLIENGVKLPATRPDLDNYDKFILDAMHEVFYDDDKRVVSISSEKLYSDVARTSIKAIIKLIK